MFEKEHKKCLTLPLNRSNIIDRGSRWLPQTQNTGGHKMTQAIDNQAAAIKRVSHKYRTIWRSESYKAEIYDNCYARIQVRGDGARARMIVDGTKWHGNTGGFAVETSYYDGRDAVRRLIRDLRGAQIRAITSEYGNRKSWFIPRLIDGTYYNIA